MARLAEDAWRGAEPRLSVVNSVLRAVAASHPEEGEYVDTWRMFTNRFRSYVDYQRNDKGELVRMRGADGVHYAPAAGDVLARDLLERLRARYELMGDGIH